MAKREYMCGCFTLRVGVTLTCIVYVLVGLTFFLDYIKHKITGVNFGLTPSSSCQGSQCTPNVFEVLSCDHLEPLTWYIEEFVYSIGALPAGIYGYIGMVSRDTFKLKVFYWFMVVQSVTAAVTWSFNNVFVEVCGRLPTTYWLYLNLFIPTRLELVHTMGLAPDVLPPQVLEQLIGIPCVRYIRIAELFPILFSLYCQRHVWAMCENLGKGPLGLGAAYGINFTPETVDTLLEVQAGITSGIKKAIKPEHPAFPVSNLQLGQKDWPAKPVVHDGVDYKPQKGWCTGNKRENPLYAKFNYGTMDA